MKTTILGRNGFIGKALWKALEKDNELYPYLRKDVGRVYWFSAPSSQILFEHAPDYCHKITMALFLNVMNFCSQYNIKLIYPSSATVYNLNNDYARCKKAIEKEAEAYPNSLGLRIFAGYGVGEKHKGEYASIIYQFCQQMKKGKSPVIYGNGQQTRDFIYIDDIVENIIKLSDQKGIVDIGTGLNTSFNLVVEFINRQLETNIRPIYKHAPLNYTEDTPCQNPVDFKVSVSAGIRKILYA